MKSAAFFALLALTTVSGSNPSVDHSIIDQIRNQFYSLEDQLWRNVSNPSWSESGLGGDVELTKTMLTFTDQLKSVPGNTRPPMKFWLWKKVNEKLSLIEGMYKHCVDFASRQTVPGSVPAPIREWMDLIESVLLDQETSIKIAMEDLHDLLKHGDLFRSALREMHPDLCDLQVSPHQLIYDMYNTVALTEIKGYAMMQFSWMLLRIYGKGNFTQEASLTRQRYGERTVQTATAARAALGMARRDVFRCEPTEHKEGETYAQVTRLLQGYLINEVDMNDRGTCGENCAFYTLARRHSCYHEVHCDKLPTCDGRIIDCRYIDSDMWVCPASRSSSRRYEWIEYENGQKFGKAGSCTRGKTKVDSWWRWLFWHCSYCMCLCDEAGDKSHRYFSLWDSTSDVNNNKWNLNHCSYCYCLCEDPAQIAERLFSLKEVTADLNMNKVVTGIKFVKLGRVFHLQISEGILGERGNVTPGTWVPIQAFDPNDMEMREGVDFHTLSYEKRAMDLDELDSPAGHVLTGVRFRMIGAHLHFEIRATPFNYTTGRLIPARSQWISNDNTEGAEKPRKELQLLRADVPTSSSLPLQVDSRHDQYIQFVNTDFEKDAAQSTVPFIDIQPLMPMKGASLTSGAGVIHRGAPGSGGFIALKLYTYDYSRHVKAEAPPSTFTEDNSDFPVPEMVN